MEVLHSSPQPGEVGREAPLPPHAQHPSLATLDTLLPALRQAGLHVGITEMLRLQQVFAQQPPRLLAEDAVAHRRLLAILRAVLVKRKEDLQTFERVCAVWLQ